MRKELKFIKKEDEVSHDIDGNVSSSVEKQYFKYTCHEVDAECQIVPIVCRVVDNFKPHDEPVWQVDSRDCDRCIKIDARVLEDVYTSAKAQWG